CGHSRRRYRHSFPTRRSSDLEAAVANTDVVSVGDGLEVVELDLFQLDRGLDPDVGLREEVRVSVDPQAPPFEHRGGEMKLGRVRSEEHTSELQSRRDLVCRLL